MKQLPLNDQLIKFFRNDSEMLLFDGFAAYDSNAVVYNCGNSYALAAKVGDVNKLCVKTDSLDFLREVLCTLDGKTELCGADTWVTEWLRPLYPFVWETNCYLYVWDGRPIDNPCTQQIRPMTKQFAELISNGTPYRPPVADIEECLDMYPSAAVWLDGKPISWCIMHNDKSLGMLYTLPEHRHKGYALQVMTALCNAVIAQGDTPYAYIRRDNVASQKLAEKYNLRRVKAADYFLIELHRNGRSA